MPEYETTVRMPRLELPICLHYSAKQLPVRYNGMHCMRKRFGTRQSGTSCSLSSVADKSRTALRPRNAHLTAQRRTSTNHGHLQ